MPNKSSKSPAAASDMDALFARVVAAFEGDGEVTHGGGGKGFGSNALKVNGKIFAMVSSRGEFVVKLARARVAELVEAGAGKPFDPGRGRLMKEWLALAPNSKRQLELAREARAYVGG